MNLESKKEKKITDRLLNKYRLVILNENTFEERFAMKLSRLNVFVLFSLSAICLVFLTTLLIAFTPIREYIPGYSSTELKKRATQLTYKTDSIQWELELNQQYLASIRRVLAGEIQESLKTKKLEKESNKAVVNDKKVEDVHVQKVNTPRKKRSRKAPERLGF